MLSSKARREADRLTRDRAYDREDAPALGRQKLAVDEQA
jgi:hypothetical protein